MFRGGSSSGLRRRDPTHTPELHCACGLPVSCHTARTCRNYQRKFLHCDACKLWIWEDLLNKYVSDAVDFYQSSRSGVVDTPKLICGCGRPAFETKAISPRGIHQECLVCERCKTWVWQFELNQYIDDMLFYCQTATIDCLQTEIKSCRELIASKDQQICRMERELVRRDDVLTEGDAAGVSSGQNIVPAWWSPRSFIKLSLYCFCVWLLVKYFCTAV